MLQGDPGELSHEVQEKLGGHWMYWNPEVAPKLGDVIFYRVVVKHRDLYWTKEGQYVVDKGKLVFIAGSPGLQSVNQINGFIFFTPNAKCTK